MQGNGAEMLRLACCLAVERGIHVCAPVHDALLIQAPLDELDDAVAATQQAMAEASAAVLTGFRLRSDVKTVRYPDRYVDERGAKMWDTVQRILKRLESKQACVPAPTLHGRYGNVTRVQAHTRPILLSVLSE